MLSIFLSLIMSAINFSFALMNHPLAITIMIILQTLCICIMMGSISYSFWFSYILFLIFLGGMLVLFIYMTSLASNEMFQLPSKTMIYVSMSIISMTLIIVYLNHFLPNILNTFSKQDTTQELIMTLSSELPQNLSQLYNFPIMNITIMLISYLLLTLIVIVKITQIHEGPLRQMS